MKKCIKLIGVGLIGISCSCSEAVGDGTSLHRLPLIHPDYIGVTIPPNIAPLTFALPDSCRGELVAARFKGKNYETTVTGSDGQVAISPRKWKRLIADSDSVSIEVLRREDGQWQAYDEFAVYVAPEPVDTHIAYRLIEPGYEIWNEMGIYQRNLENYNQEAILTNRQTNHGCMNCHSFCMQSPERMLYHLRVDFGGTYVLRDGKVEKLNTKTPETMSALVYPSWHPSGRYVAFSVNDTKQMFHTTDRNRIEVFDYKSDVVVYDVEKHEIVSSPLLMADAAFETFPTFSPDGQTLYFCSADSVGMPAGYDQVKYSLCSIAFDAERRQFGEQVDTVYNANEAGHSVSFPKVSPDGRFLMFTRHDYGNFSIWHREADLYMADLESGEIRSLDALNSAETDSYHSWSSNGRWVVFSSRRLDGLYTRPYIGYIDADGSPRKPFLVPQEHADHYDVLMKSFNVPEFITGPMDVPSSDLVEAAHSDGIDVSFVK